MKGITWSELLMFGTSTVRATCRRQRRIGRRGGSDRTKRIRKSEKARHIVCNGNVLFKAVSRSRIYFRMHRARRGVEGNSSTCKLELGQSLYPDRRKSSVQPD